MPNFALFPDGRRILLAANGFRGSLWDIDSGERNCFL
jgi:hypothetical protein